MYVCIHVDRRSINAEPSVRAEMAKDAPVTDDSVLSSSSVARERREDESQSRTLQTSEETRVMSTGQPSVPTVDEVSASSDHVQFASSAEVRHIRRTQLELESGGRTRETTTSTQLATETVPSGYAPQTDVGAEGPSRGPPDVIVESSSSQPPSRGHSLASPDSTLTTIGQLTTSGTRDRIPNFELGGRY